MEEIRLQKYLAEAGVASRRKAEELILQGRIRVNGEIITEMGFKVTGSDKVEFDGKQVHKEENKVYLMLNKPVGYVTTVKDQFGRTTVLDLVKEIDERLYPVGRLDYDTSGLLLLSNDGDFTYKLTHPKHELNKVYVAEVEGIPTTEEIERFEKGLRIEDYITSAAKLKILEKMQKRSTIEITIHEGKNRQVRKMCENIGHPVIKLKRVAIGNLVLSDLPEGKWRHLNKDEIKYLTEKKL